MESQDLVQAHACEQPTSGKRVGALLAAFAAMALSVAPAVADSGRRMKVEEWSKRVAQEEADRAQAQNLFQGPNQWAWNNPLWGPIMMGPILQDAAKAIQGYRDNMFKSDRTVNRP